jgi:pyruvate formate lyase activating enzyme
VKRASYWQRQNDGVQCVLCPHMCVLQEGEYGLCGARQAKDDVLVSRSYGEIAAAHIDPVEKKPLRRFMPRTHTYSIGSVGCNLCCWFCQNARLSRGHAQGGEETPASVVEKAVRAGTPSISYTYNEPVTNFEFVLETASLAQKEGLHNILVTNGYANPEPFAQLCRVIHAMNMDLKTARTDAFLQQCGGELEVVRRNIKSAAQSCHLEVTALMANGLCGAEDVKEIAQFLAGIDARIPLHITRYYPMCAQDPAATPVQTVIQAAEAAKEHLLYVYTGNI